MPRTQAKQRALINLTYRINDLLFYQDFRDTILDIRKRLGIDVEDLKQRQIKVHLDEKERIRELVEKQEINKRNEKLLHHNYLWDENRIGPLTVTLLEKHLISKYSAFELIGLKHIPDSGRFWRTIVNASENLIWPGQEIYNDVEVEYCWIIGGLCFDITNYPEQYKRTEFNRLTKQLTTAIAEYLRLNSPNTDKVMKMSMKELDDAIEARREREEKIEDYIIQNNLEEYFCFHQYIQRGILESNAFFFHIFESAHTENFDTWRKRILNKIRENRLYLDITDFSLDDIEFHWGRIERIRDGFSRVLQTGRPKNIIQRREILRNMTWSEIREYIRDNPKELIKLEHEYVDRYGQHSSKARGKAIHNFYKQVIVHPDMRDFKLQIRRRGRPRKTSN